MKKIVTILISILPILSLCGCGGTFDPEKAASNLESRIESGLSDIESKAEKVESIADGLESSIKSSLTESSNDYESEISDVISNSQIIGNDDYGYMRIPKDFKQLENESGDLQYGSDDGSVIFTMNMISPDIPASTAVTGIIGNMKEKGGTNLDSCNDAIINDMSGDEINCYFPDEDRYLTVYLVPFTDKTVYLALEYTEDTEYMLAYIQSWQNYEFND